MTADIQGPQNTFESLMLSNLLRTDSGPLEEETLSRKDTVERIAKNWVPIIAVLVAAGTLAAIGFWHLNEGFAHSILEAFFLAAILTITVDPFLKQRLVTEAAQDIFHHILGADFPVEIREEFKASMLSNFTYREAFQMAARVRKSDDGSRAVLEIDQRFDVVAVKNGATYQQLIAFEEAENGKVLRASLTSTRKPGDSYCKEAPAMTRNADDPWVFEWKGKKIKLSKRDRVNVSSRFIVKRGTSDFFQFNFVIPTIDPVLTVEAEDGLEISASHAEQMNGNEYHYKRVLVPGNHIQIRWKPKESKSAVPPPVSEHHS